MEKYIIAVDMDGTLLNSENKISERNRNVLQRLIDDGHYVVPATGRTRELIPQEFSVQGDLCCYEERWREGNLLTLPAVLP